MIIRKGPEEIERIARAGELVAATIAHVGEHLRPGITTGELDDIAGAFVAANGGTSASKGYHGTYPGRDLHLPELDGRPRHPRPVPCRWMAISSRSTSASC